MSQQALQTCACQATPPTPPPESPPLAHAVARHTARSLPSAALGVLIAFFPKCPLCWAAYLSMFGSFGLANIPYQGWLLPVLLGLLGVHLWLLVRKIPDKGYGPFLLSLAGALALVAGRVFWPGSPPALWAGMLLIMGGSLWNSFSFNRFNPSFN